MFGGQALTTKFVSATQLTASGTATTAQKGMSVQVTVVNPDPGSVASANVTLKVGTPIAVTVTPYKTQMHPGDTLQYKAMVTGTSNQSVTWKVNGIVAGNVNTVGAILSSGVYTAPPLRSQTESTITASSVEDPQSSSGGPAYAILSSNVPVVTSALPAPIPVGNFTISVSGSNFLNGAQVIFGGIMLTTTFISSTSISASGTSSAAGTVGLPVINPGTGSPTSNTLQVQGGSPDTGVTAAAAVRFLEQSTFGPTQPSIQQPTASGDAGLSEWAVRSGRVNLPDTGSKCRH
jgi:hypothetical protein